MASNLNEWILAALRIPKIGRVGVQNVVSPQQALGLVLGGHYGALNEADTPLNGVLESLSTPLEIDSNEWRLVQSALKATLANTTVDGIRELSQVAGDASVEIGMRTVSALICSVELAEQGEHAEALNLLKLLQQDIEDRADIFTSLVLRQQIVIRSIEIGAYQEAFELVSETTSRIEPRIQQLKLSDEDSLIVDGFLEALDKNYETVSRFVGSQRSKTSNSRESAQFWVDWNVEIQDALVVFAGESFKRGFGDLISMRHSITFGQTASEKVLLSLHRCRILSELFGYWNQARYVFDILGAQLLLDHDGDVQKCSQGLQLLRRAGSDSKLRDALMRVRSEGPLRSIEVEAAAAVRDLGVKFRKTSLTSVRVAAPCMSESQAEQALDILLPEYGKLGSIRDDNHIFRVGESVWRTVGALARQAKYHTRIADAVLDAVQGMDPLLLQSSSSVLSSLDWERVDKETRDRWVSWFETHISGDALFIAASAMLPLYNTGDTRILSLLSRAWMEEKSNLLSGIIVDFAYAGHLSSVESLLPQVAEFLNTSMSKVSEQAHRGVHSFGGTSPARVAAVLIAVLRANAGRLDSFPEFADLANALAEFLADESVLISDQAGAFDVLARMLDDEVANADFINDRQIERILSRIEAWRSGGRTANEMDFEGATTAAPLRFLCAAGAMPPEHSLGLYMEYTQSSDARQRYEGVMSADYVSLRVPVSVVVGTLLQMTLDASVMVRSVALMKLASMLDRLDLDLAKVAVSRILPFLHSDGLTMLSAAIYSIKEIAKIDAVYVQREEVRKILIDSLEQVRSKAIRASLEEAIELWSSR